MNQNEKETPEEAGALPQPEASEEAAAPAVEYDTFHITVGAATKLNIGDYSSAERSIHLGSDIRIPRGTPEENLMRLREEIKKLQMIAELQTAAIVTEVMSRDGLNNPGWHGMFMGIFRRVLDLTRKAYGIVTPPLVTVTTAPPTIEPKTPAQP